MDLFEIIYYYTIKQQYLKLNNYILHKTLTMYVKWLTFIENNILRKCTLRSTI